MEEIKQLYQRLNYASVEEREKIWKIIIEKNKALFNKRRKELSKILKKVTPGKVIKTANIILGCVYNIFFIPWVYE